jgi:DNA-binding NarL/FixJ family response regulator
MPRTGNTRPAECPGAPTRRSAAAVGCQRSLDGALRAAPIGCERAEERGCAPEHSQEVRESALTRVIVAEDLFLLRDGLVRLLEAHGFEIAAAVEDAPGLLAALISERPDVAIVDVRLPPTFTDDGLRAAIEARRQVPGLPVLVLSQYVEQLYARELLADRAGGVGYLLKDRVFNDDQFVDAVRTVAAGGTVMDAEVVSKLLGRRAREETLARLSAREREVLELMAEGRSNSAIAQRLSVTEKAVSKHSTSIFTKLDLVPSDDDNRRVLAVLAYLNG